MLEKVAKDSSRTERRVAGVRVAGPERMKKVEKEVDHGGRKRLRGAPYQLTES
jgi:hypothetical protein